MHFQACKWSLKWGVGLSLWGETVFFAWGGGFFGVGKSRGGGAFFGPPHVGGGGNETRLGDSPPRLGGEFFHSPPCWGGEW